MSGLNETQLFSLTSQDILPRRARYQQLGRRGDATRQRGNRDVCSH